MIETNTFGGNKYRLGLHNRGSDSDVREFNIAGAKLARDVADAAPHKVLVAGSIGPTGSLLEPLGPLSVSEARSAFAVQAAALGEAKVDFFLVETMSALEEVEAAVLGCRDACPTIPVAVTMSFGRRGRTMMGVTPKVRYIVCGA